MADPSLALQKAFVGALRGATDAAGNVFDDVPASNPFPRITLGEGQSIGDFADCIDGTESFLSVDVWSRAVGFPEAKAIADQARQALHAAALDLDGHRLVLIEFRDQRMVRDPDGLTAHIAMTFRALTEPEDGSGT